METQEKLTTNDTSDTFSPCPADISLPDDDIEKDNSRSRRPRPKRHQTITRKPRG